MQSLSGEMDHGWENFKDRKLEVPIRNLSNGIFYESCS